MSSRIRALLPRGRLLRWMFLALVLGPFLLLGLVLLFGSIFRVEVQVDLALIGFAIAAVLLAAVLFLVVRHLVQPKQTLSVGFRYELFQPALPLGRYSFRLEVFYELEEKGERARVEQGTIELKFRRRDHPEVLAWCCSQVARHLKEHERFAAERYPGARVLLPPGPTPELLASEVEWSKPASGGTPGADPRPA